MISTFGQDTFNDDDDDDKDVDEDDDDDDDEDDDDDDDVENNGVDIISYDVMRHDAFMSLYLISLPYIPLCLSHLPSLLLLLFLPNLITPSHPLSHSVCLSACLFITLSVSHLHFSYRKTSAVLSGAESRTYMTRLTSTYKHRIVTSAYSNYTHTHTHTHTQEFTLHNS